MKSSKKTKEQMNQEIPYTYSETEIKNKIIEFLGN